MLITQVLFCTFFYMLKSVLADETLCAINSKKCLNTVNDKFLSISIDPALIISGVNSSFTTVLLLAQHLSPAFIQIAGPSTNLIKFKRNDDSKDQLPDNNNMILTPFMWESLHDWLSLAKLEPIFGLSDSEKVNGVWNPRPFLPLWELSDKLNISCYWQLGNDCSNTNSAQYKKDLIVLRRILDVFTGKKEAWKIVGDIHKCPNFKLGDDLKGVVDSVILKENNKRDDFLKYKMPTWMIAPKSEHSIDFLSALSWAKQIGDAAKNGFEAIFRNLSVQELINVTPVYWVSLLHKNLMGRKVLDIKVLESNKNISVYAHCTKNQNSFAKRGALTVLFVNEEDREKTISLKIGGSNQENIEIRSYILTSRDEEPNDIFLNDEKLWTEDLEKEQIIFTPKVHRARVIAFVSLTAPPKSISFFVLPSARIPACINNEDETQQLVQEIHEDQTIDFSLEISPKVTTRNGHSIDELYTIIDDEIKSNEKHKRLTPRRVDRSEPSGEDEKNTTKDLKALKLRHFILEKTKNWEKQRKDQASKEFVPQLSNELQKIKKTPHSKQTKTNHQQNERKSTTPIGLKNFELTAQEVRKILLDRIKAKAAERNLEFTNEELNQLLNIATKKISNEIRPRRDINMNMLRLKAGGLSSDKHKLKLHTQSQSSEEFIDDSESSLEKQLEEMTSTETKRKFEFKPAPKLRKAPKTHFLKPKLHPKEENMEITLKDVIQNLLEDGFEIVPSPTVKSHQSIFDNVEHVQQSHFNPNDLQIGEFYIIPKHHQFENEMESSVLNLKNYFTKARTVEEEHDGINFSLENDYTHFDSGETPRFKRELENSVSSSMERLHYVIGKPYDPSKLKIDENQMNKQKKLLKKRLYLKKRMQKKANTIKTTNDLKTKLQKNSSDAINKSSI